MTPPSPGWARGGAARIPRRWPEFPSTQCAQTRIEREVQEQKRTILRHKQGQNHKHTHTHTHAYTPETHNCKNAHSRAHSRNHTHKLLQRRAIHRNAPSPTAHSFHHPLSFSQKQKPSYHSAKDCQNFRMRTNETYRNRPFVWIILYIKCSKSCLMSTYNETFFFLKKGSIKKGLR